MKKFYIKSESPKQKNLQHQYFAATSLPKKSKIKKGNLAIKKAATHLLNIKANCCEAREKLLAPESKPLFFLAQLSVKDDPSKG